MRVTEKRGDNDNVDCGVSILVSGDGSRAVMSCAANGISIAYLYVFEYSLSGWDMESSGQIQSDSVYNVLRVQLSYNGKRMGIGNKLSDTNGVDSGDVRVYAVLVNTGN